MAVREILRYPNVQKITLVDLDGDITRLFKTQPLLTRLNGDALNALIVSVVNADAFTWFATNRQRFDFVVADFPDPSNFSLGKLYTTTFFQRVRSTLEPGGALVVNAPHPMSPEGPSGA